MCSDAKDFGKAVRRLRQEHMVQQTDVASGAGLALQTVSRIEFGQRQPSLDTALKISNYLERATGVAILTMNTKGEMK